MLKLFSLVTAILLLFFAPDTVQAEISYSDVYSSVVEDAVDRHYNELNNGTIDPNYSSIGYALSDITGDGVCELIIRQMAGKHWSEYWVYGTDGESCYHMGDFECDARSLYGYEEGILYEEAYKGSLTLGFAEWKGSDFVVNSIFTGTYNREAIPPTIPELSYCYDYDRLIEEIPEFISLDYGAVISRGSAEDSYGITDPHNLNDYDYRTVNTGGRGALVFQTSPEGSFLSNHSFNDGASIYVNLTWRENGYAIAYENGVYGYVDASYIRW